MQISATNIPLAKFDLNCLRGTPYLSTEYNTINSPSRKSSCNYTFPVTETTLKFNYPEKTAWISGTIGIIGDNGKVMNTTEWVLGLPQWLRWHTRMDWSFFLLVYRIFKTSETMLSNRSNLPYVCLVVTWDQALFSFRFENYIPAGKRMYENRSNWAWSQVSLVAMFNTSPISTKCDITVRTCKLLRRIIPLEEIDQNCLQLSYALFFSLIYISLTFSERDVGIALSYSDKNHFEASISRKTNFKSSIWKWQRRHFWKLRENTLLSSWRHDGQDQQTKRQPRREPWERGWQNEQTTYQVHPPLVPRFISS